MSHSERCQSWPHDELNRPGCKTPSWKGHIGEVAMLTRGGATQTMCGACRKHDCVKTKGPRTRLKPAHLNLLRVEEDNWKLAFSREPPLSAHEQQVKKCIQESDSGCHRKEKDRR